MRRHEGAASREGHVREVLRDLSERIGAPSQYGGGAYGLDIRWRTASHTVLLNARHDELLLSVHWTTALEDSERERFSACADGEPEAGEGLPYLWRYQRCAPPQPSPVSPVTHTWAQLQDALETLLRSWSQHLEALAGEDDAGFNIDHGDGQLAIMVSPRDEISVFADSRDGTDRNAEHLHAMTTRGWHSFTPGLCWWDACFDRTPAGAAAAAQLVVAELQARGVHSPSDLRLIRASLGAEGGILDVPGSGIAAEPSPPSRGRASAASRDL